MPADAVLYVAVETDAPRFFGSDSLDGLLQSVDLQAADVRPWIGDGAALFASGDGLGLALATRDESAAEAFAQRDREQLPHSRIVDGHLVLASRRELLDAAEASEGFDAPEGHGVTVIDNERGFAPAEPWVLPQGTGDALKPFLAPRGRTTVRLQVERNAAVIEAGGLPRAPPAPSLEDLPSAAWFAIAAGDLGQTIAALADDFPLPDTPHWKDAVRRLGGEPTLLIEIVDAERALRGSFGPLTYVAARATGGGTLRAVLVGGRP